MPDFNFLTTHVGSVPHVQPDGLSARLARLLDVPAWTQHPRRTFRESMYVQYSPPLPAVEVDLDRQKIILNTGQDLSAALEAFYASYLSEDFEAFALRDDYACGFPAMLTALASSAGGWAKGQVTGPISFGLTVTDQSLRAVLYDETLADVIVKNMASTARWQARRLKSVRPNVIIFLDEPYMASFGSAFISLSRQHVITWLDEAFEAIHAEGALAGVHCCANTDWGVLLATQVDILNLDAYGFIENLALYPAELRSFLDRGGAVCWGIIPNTERVFQETAAGLAARLRSGMQMIAGKARLRGVQISVEEFASRSLIAPACGLGSSSVEVADRVFELLAETGALLKRG